MTHVSLHYTPLVVASPDFLQLNISACAAAGLGAAFPRISSRVESPGWFCWFVGLFVWRGPFRQLLGGKVRRVEHRDASVPREFSKNPTFLLARAAATSLSLGGRKERLGT